LRYNELNYEYVNRNDVSRSLFRHAHTQKSAIFMAKLKHMYTHVNYQLEFTK